MCDPLPDLVVIDLKNFSPIRSVRARDIYSDGCKRGEKKLSGVRRKMAFEVLQLNMFKLSIYMKG